MSDIENEKSAAEADASTEAGQVEDAVVVEVESEDLAPVEDVAPIEETTPDVSEPTPPSKSLGLMSFIAGGVVAGAIGFGAATYLNFGGNTQTEALVADLSARLDTQAQQFDALQAEVSRVEGLADTSALAERIQAISADLGSQPARVSPAEIEALAAGMTALEARLLDVEKRPMSESLPADAIAAYEAEMNGLRESIAKQRADIEAMAAEAREMEARARAETIKSEGTNWLTDISVAIASGQPFVAPVEALGSEGIEVPDALRLAAQDGVSTLAELSETFPVSARAALAAIRSAETDGSGAGGIMTFLQNQLGVRSVSPRDGASADAILSRAEASVKAGEVVQALAEINALPEIGLFAMADWVAQAHERIAVEAARDVLKEQIVNE